MDRLDKLLEEWEKELEMGRERYREPPTPAPSPGDTARFFPEEMHGTQEDQTQWDEVMLETELMQQHEVVTYEQDEPFECGMCGGTDAYHPDSQLCVACRTGIVSSVLNGCRYAPATRWTD